MLELNPFKKALIGSTALIGGSLLAPATALAASCPATITGTTFANISCDFNISSSVTIENGGTVGGLQMNNYQPTSSFLLINSGGTIANTTGIGIAITSGSSLTGGITNNGTLSAPSGIGIAGNSAVSGGITNNGLISSTVGASIAISTSSLTGGITNYGTIANTSGVGISILNTSTITGGITNSGAISSHTTGIAILGNDIISGDITNSGLIASTVATGIRITTSTINGDIINSGAIRGGGIDSGITIFNSSTITGGILNTSSGRIQSANGNAIALSNSNITSGITNNGAITSSGGNGIYIGNVSHISDGIDNSGTITGGQNGILLLSSSTIGGIINETGGSIFGNNNGIEISLSTISGRIVNHANATIHGGNTGIFVSSAAISSGIQNSGTISGGTYGINVHGNSTSIINDGIISGGTYGINVDGSSTSIINDGTIDSGNSIALTGNNNSVTLGMNSFTRGTIAFTGAANTLIYDVANVPRTGGVIYVGGNITGADTVAIANAASLPAGAQIVQGSNSVAVITPEEFGGTQQLINQMLTDAGSVLNNRQQLALLGDTTEAAGGRQYAASTASLSDAGSPGSWALRDRKVAWAEGFGSYQERGADKDVLASNARAGGIMTGIDLPQTDSGYRSGIYLGGFSGRLTMGDPAFRSIDSTGGMAGGYIGKSMGGYYVSGQLGVGISDNNSDRFTGVDTASANYNSYFVSPSLTVIHPIAGSGITWVPSATVRYTAQLDDGYTENGSVVNQAIDSRTTSSLGGRLMLEARLDPKAMGQGTLKTALRAGIQGQTLLGSNKVNVQALGTNLSFDPKGGDNYVDGVLGANVVRSLDDHLDLYGDAEGNLGLNKGGPGSNKGIAGRIGVRWKL